MKTFLAILLLSASAFGQAWSGILSSGRAVDWTYAGVPGGIPSGSWANCTTTACNTAYASPTVANVNSACATAPDNTVVRIPAGSYTWSTSVYCNNSNTVLRGAGPTQTFITLGTGANILMGNGTSGQGSYPTGLGSTNITAGLTQGSTVLTVASTTGLSAGQTVVVDQQNAAWVYTTGVEGPCTSGNSCGRNDSPLQFNGSSTRAQQQMVLIHSVDSGTQITLEAPGLGQDYSIGLTPQVFFWNTPKNYQYEGIENMSVNANDNDHALSLPFCDYCWVKNVAITNATNRGNVFFFWGYRDELRDSYIGGSTSTAHPQEYGVDFLETTFTKIENNIFYDSASPVVGEGSYGTVIGYNYTLNQVTDNQFGSVINHLTHAWKQLWEGNVTAMLMLDNSWGSSSHVTMFRNRASGKDPNKTNYREAIKVASQSHYVNVVGNVIGDPTYHTRYRCDNVDTSQSDNFEYGLGFWNDCINGIDANNPYDTVTQSSLVRWGNWDAVTYNASGASHLGTRYCTGSGAGSSGSDAYNTACTASETASTDPTFPGLASPSTTLPTSFYLASKPTWFNSVNGTTNVTWPPIGPDVTGGSITNTGGHAYKIPAQLCYDNTTKDASGFLTAFDAATCYPGGPSSYPRTVGSGRTLGAGHSVN